jgi:putative membrane protein
MRSDAVLVWLHVIGNLFWIGAVAAAGLLLVVEHGERVPRAELALILHRRLAMPAFVLSFVAGTARLALEPRYYFVEHHWMHGKLVFALAAIALHHVLGARARKIARGAPVGPARALVAAFAVCAAAAAFFVLLRLPD